MRRVVITERERKNADVSNDVAVNVIQPLLMLLVTPVPVTVARKACEVAATERREGHQSLLSVGAVCLSSAAVHQQTMDMTGQDTAGHFSPMR